MMVNSRDEPFRLILVLNTRPKPGSKEESSVKEPSSLWEISINQSKIYLYRQLLIPKWIQSAVH